MEINLYKNPHFQVAPREISIRPHLVKFSSVLKSTVASPTQILEAKKLKWEKNVAWHWNLSLPTPREKLLGTRLGHTIKVRSCAHMRFSLSKHVWMCTWVHVRIWHFSSSIFSFFPIFLAEIVPYFTWERKHRKMLMTSISWWPGLVPVLGEEFT